MTELLLPRIANGDQVAVEACLERYSGLVWSLARRFLRDQGAAEDAVQEIFIELWKVAARFDPAKGSELAFIGTLARRRLIDRVRRRTRRPESHTLVEEPTATAHHPEQQLANEEQLALAKTAIASLQAQQRQAIELALYDGLSHREVSERLKIPLGTTKSLIHRGLDAVRKRLTPVASHAPRLS